MTQIPEHYILATGGKDVKRLRLLHEVYGPGTEALFHRVGLRDGKAAEDVVGHRLSFTGNRFQIQSKDGKPLYAGTFRVDTSTKPTAIDFEHTEGDLKGKSWKGIYALDGDTLTTCDNAPNLDKGRPAAFEAKTGSGYVFISFERAKP